MLQRALVLFAFAAAGCAVMDGLTHGGLFDGCETDQDCDTYDQVCTSDGCRDARDLGTAALCSADHDCNALVLGGVDVVCPATLASAPAPGSCSCLGGACAAEVGVSCSAAEDCPDGQFCRKENSTCYQPFACTFHDDCSGGLCTTEGCSNSNSARYCSDESDCVAHAYGCDALEDCDCLNDHCYGRLGASCSKTSDCGPNGLCSIVDGNRCRDPKPSSS